MRKVLYLLIITLLAIGCSKNEPDDSYNYQLLKEYGLLNKFNLDNLLIHQLNDSTISFSGKLKDSPKIDLVVFNSTTKNKLIDITPYESDQLIIDKPYGGKVTVTIYSVICTQLIQNGNTTMIYIETPGTRIISPTVAEVSPDYNTYRYLFIRDNTIIKSIDTPSYCSDILIKWKQNFILHNCDGIYLYSPSGEIITEVNYGTDSFDNFYDFVSQAEILNDYEGIFTTYNGDIARFDLREYDYIWTASVDLSKLDRPRIDDTKLISKTDTHFTYEISYTEYNGNKGVIKFKVNIETGEIEYL